MTTVLGGAQTIASTRAASPGTVRVALLGLGSVGGAIAELARKQIDPSYRFSIVSALVRDVHRPRPSDGMGILLTTDPEVVLASRFDVLIEVLGGLEPARTIVLAALRRRVPVVTANKSLLAVHGDELFEAAAAHGAALLYEASVLAGVPFLGTFHRRPLAREVRGISGIVNGTSNFILSRMLADRVGFADALAEAQRAGYAEPDAAKDVRGDDAVEKLCVLLRHFAALSVAPGDVERAGIVDVEPADLQQALSFGGRIRPVVMAEWSPDGVLAFAGPAFVSASNGLATVEGVQNAVSLRTRWAGDLFFGGPGAGPAVTAATILDDVVEAGDPAPHPMTLARRPGEGCAAPQTGWFVRLMSPALAEHDAPALLTSLGVRIRRHSPVALVAGERRQWLLTHACSREHLAAVLDILAARKQSTAWPIRAIE